MMTRRSIARSALLVTVLLAGCSGLISGDEPVSATADRITVAEKAVSGSEFEFVSDEPVTFERSLSVAGQSRTIEATAGLAHLQREENGSVPAQVVVLSVPTVEVLEQRISLAEEIGPTSLVARAQEVVGDLESEQKIGERKVAILGSERTVEIFSARAAQDGTDVELRTVVTSFTHGEDTIIAVGIAPRVTDSTDRILGLFEAIERPSS